MSTKSTRVRQIPAFGLGSKFVFSKPEYRSGRFATQILPHHDNPTLYNDGMSRVRGIQITESEGHAWPRKGHDLQDRGGPFYTRKLYLGEMSHRRLDKQLETKTVYKNVVNDYFSPVQVNPFLYLGDRDISGYPDPSTSDEDLMILGTKAIASASPVSPIVSLPVTIGELIRDGLPTMAGLKALKAKGKPDALADEYLNYQFGIKPLVSDLKDLGYALRKADKLIAQLKRDSGRVVRRRVDLGTEKEVTEDGVFFGAPSTVWLLDRTIDPSLPRVTSVAIRRKVTISKKRWFSGAFTYVLPNSREHDNIRRMSREAERLFGLVPDASDVWNLLPWSWLGDWFVDVGPVIQNATNAQTFGQVLLYGYVMEHTIKTYEYTLDDPPVGWAGLGDATLTIHDEVKKRVMASPYGFGSDWEEFSPYQISILAALGITRARPIAR